MALDLTDLNTAMSEFNAGLISAIETRLSRGSDTSTDEAFALAIRNFHEKSVIAAGFTGGILVHEFPSGGVAVFEGPISGISMVRLNNVPAHLLGGGDGRKTFSFSAVQRLPAVGGAYPATVIINGATPLTIRWPDGEQPESTGSNNYEVMTIDFISVPSGGGSETLLALGSVRGFN